MTRVLLCGATGFIGRNLLERLAPRADLQLVAVYNKRPSFIVPIQANEVHWINADLRNPKDVERCMNGVDIVIQAAATTSGSKDIVSRPFIHVTDNAVMNSLLLRQAFEQKVKHFIFFSCTVMYQSSNEPIKESDWSAADPLHQRYFGVGHTKIYIERMLEFFSSISQMKTTAIRHSNIYGPYDKFDLDRSHVFGATVTKTMLAKEEIVVWGTGEEERDLLHVDDLCDFVEATIARQPNGFRLYNCGAGEKVSIKNLVSEVVRASGKNVNIKHALTQPTIAPSFYLDNGLATRELGWFPKTSLAAGIKRTVAWWREYIDPQSLQLKVEKQ